MSMGELNLIRPDGDTISLIRAAMKSGEPVKIIAPDGAETLARVYSESIDMDTGRHTFGLRIVTEDAT